MKESLVKLLFEEYKQTRLFDELEQKGIDLTNITIKNLDIVCDILGFPPNTYFKRFVNPDTGRLEEIYNKDGFDREPIYLKFDGIYDSIEKIQNIEVTDNGLKMTEHEDEALAIKKISEYVDWLYQEQKKLT